MYETISSRGVRGMILHAIENASKTVAWATRLVETIPSDQAAETYADIGLPPAMRLWLNGRKPAELREDSLIIKNAEFETSMLVKKRSLRRDKLGRLKKRIAELSLEPMQHWNDLAVDLLKLGTTKTCFDGQFYFDTTHPIRDKGTVQSNDITISLTALAAQVPNVGSTTHPSIAAMSLAINRAIINILGMRADTGRTIFRTQRKFQIIVPLNLMESAEAAVVNPFVEVGLSNPGLSNNIQKIVDVEQQLTDAGAESATFYVGALETAQEPFIFQDESGPNVTAKAENSDFEHDTGNHEYGIDASRGAGYGAYQSMTRATIVA